MNPTTTLPLGAAALLFFLFNSTYTSAQAITIDGDPSDWIPNNYLIAPDQYNLAHIVRDTNGFGQYIWNDKPGDERTFFATPDNRVDIIEFRVTGDTANLYFLIHLADIPPDSTNGFGAPMVKITFDTDLSSGSGYIMLFDSTDTAISEDAAWEYMLTTLFGSGSAYVSLTDTSLISMNTGAASINEATNCIEIAIPRGALGLSLPSIYSGPLRMTVSTFRTDTNDTSIDINGNSESDAIDAITNYALPGDTSNTFTETNDQIIDYFFDVCFAYDGMVAAPLLISEVLYDPSGSEPAAEFVEIRNPMPGPLELRGYRLGDEETMNGGEGMYAFPPGSGAIQPDSFIVIARDGSVFESTYGWLPDFETSNTSDAPDMETFLEWGSGGMSLGNSGDEVLLIDSCETIVDVVVWESASWPGLNNDPPISAPNGNSIDREPNGFGDNNDMQIDFSITANDGNPGNGPDTTELDNDNDGVFNIVDNCPDTYNPIQSDIDNDGTGDLCDPDFITNDNIGIGISNPQTRFHLKDGIMFLDNNSGGILMRSPQGDCWSISINNEGVVETVIVDCPN